MSSQKAHKDNFWLGIPFRGCFNVASFFNTDMSLVTASGR